MSPARSSIGLSRAGGIGDQVGAIERLAVPDRHRQQLELRAVGQKGRTADPGAVELAGNQERRNLLIGAARDQLDRPAGRFLEIGFQQVEEIEVGRQQDRASGRNG